MLTGLQSPTLNKQHTPLYSNFSVSLKKCVSTGNQIKDRKPHRHPVNQGMGNNSKRGSRWHYTRQEHKEKYYEMHLKEQGGGKFPGFRSLVHCFCTVSGGSNWSDSSPTQFPFPWYLIQIQTLNSQAEKNSQYKKKKFSYFLLPTAVSLSRTVISNTLPCHLYQYWLFV